MSVPGWGVSPVVENFNSDRSVEDVTSSARGDAASAAKLERPTASVGPDESRNAWFAGSQGNAWSSWDSQSSSWCEETDYTNISEGSSTRTEPPALGNQFESMGTKTVVEHEHWLCDDSNVYAFDMFGWKTTSDDSSAEADVHGWSSSWSDDTGSSAPDEARSAVEAETDPGAIVKQVAAVDLATLAAAGLLGAQTPAGSPSKPAHLAAPQNTGAQVDYDALMAGVTLVATNEAGTSPGEATAAVEMPTLICPLCKRLSEETRHRLGLHWRTLGYNGPPYCSRCASLFRTHIIRREVSTGYCSRETPCRSCSAVLQYFDKEAIEDAYRRIDAKAGASDAKGELAQKRRAEAAAVAPCPYCRKTTAKSSMGLLW
jgi:hypothetical protein